ncbi:MAG: Mur ligase domain-containing protein [Bacteroidales bacterium]
MKVHFIAIGGAVMHNLAIALHLKGFEVTGSDDEIFDPPRTGLKNMDCYLQKEDGFQLR